MNYTASKLVLVNSETTLILLVRSLRHWTLPGGKIEQGETPEEALHRELQEELPNLQYTLLPYTSVHLKDGWLNKVYYGFTDTIKVKIAREIQETVWAHLSNIHKYSTYWMDGLNLRMYGRTIIMSKW